MASSPTTERALWYTQPGRAAIVSCDVAPPGETQLYVRAIAGAVSRGTERLVFQGRVPASERGRMRAPFQEGEFTFPLKYGYAVVGQGVAGDPALTNRRVFVLHPHQTGFVVPAEAAVPVPDAVPSERAVLAANMETALNAVWDAAIGPCDRVAVVGGGVVGMLTAWLAGRIPGTEVSLVDVAPERAGVCDRLGLAFALPRDAAGGCDVVLHASGDPAGLDTALSLAGREAVVVELSWYGDKAVTATLGGAFHAQRLTLRASQVGAVSPSHRPRWTHRRRLAAALALLADDRLDALIGAPVAFDDLPEALPAILAEGGDASCPLVRYR